MDKIQRRALSAVRCYFANELADLLRDPRNWQEVYLPSDPDYGGVRAEDYIHYKEQKPYTYELKFTRFRVTFKLSLRYYIWTLAPYVHDLQTVCPNHNHPYKLFRLNKPFPNCQHNCDLGFILNSPNSPYRASEMGYRIYTEKGYQQEHVTLLQQLLNDCILLNSSLTLIEWDDVVKNLAIDKSVIFK